MRKYQFIAAILLGTILIGVSACNPFESKTEVNEELVEVVRGDLAVTVSGTGNIEVSNETKLSFGVGGKIEKIYVDEGDEVSKGDVLAKLETDTLELALNEAKVAYSQAQISVLEAEAAVVEAEIAVGQAETSLQTAEWTLEQTQDQYYLVDIKIAQSDVDSALRNLEDALWKLDKYEEGSEGQILYSKSVVQAQARYQAAKDRLDAIVAGFNAEEVEIKELQVLVAKQSLDLAEQSLELAKRSPALARQSLALAEQSLKVAQKQLNDATITAPFDSTIAKVFVDEGDIIPAPTLGTTQIIQVIDPEKMELNVQVDEIDIIGVMTGQKAIIETDAIPDFTIDGTVAFISLLPTELSGVVVYDAEIYFNIPEGSGLRAGMSATADIMVAERINVLLVPARAIREDSQGNSIVGVMVDGQIEERVVIIGISDGFQTEILDGLEEGEMIERRARSK